MLENWWPQTPELQLETWHSCFHSPGQQNSFIWVFHWETMNAGRATFVKFRAGTAAAELCNAEFDNRQRKEHEKQRRFQRGRRL